MLIWGFNLRRRIILELLKLKKIKMQWQLSIFKFSFSVGAVDNFEWLMFSFLWSFSWTWLWDLISKTSSLAKLIIWMFCLKKFLYNSQMAETQGSMDLTFLLLSVLSINFYFIVFKRSFSWIEYGHVHYVQYSVLTLYILCTNDGCPFIWRICMHSMYLIVFCFSLSIHLLLYYQDCNVTALKCAYVEKTCPVNGNKLELHLSN